MTIFGNPRMNFLNPVESYFNFSLFLFGCLYESIKHKEKLDTIKVPIQYVDSVSFHSNVVTY